MRRQVESSQRKTRILGVVVDGTGAAAVSGPDSFQVSLTDNGTGDYTITFDEPFALAPIAVATPVTTDIICRVKAITATAVTIECLSADTPAATDADFHLFVYGSDVADKI